MDDSTEVRLANIEQRLTKIEASITILYDIAHTPACLLR